MKKGGQIDITLELYEKILTEMCEIPFEKWMKYRKHNKNSRQRRRNYGRIF